MLRVYEDLQLAGLLERRRKAAEKRMQWERADDGTRPRSPRGPRSTVVQAAEDRISAAKRAAKLQRQQAEAAAKNSSSLSSGIQAFAELEMKLKRKKGASQSGGTGLTAAQIPLQAPVEPDPLECCGNDCANCVWIVYWEKLQAWQASQDDGEQSEVLRA